VSVKLLTLRNRDCGLRFNQSDSKIYTTSNGSTLGSTGITVTTGRWYRLDLKIDISSNPWIIDGMVDGFPLAQVTNAVAANTDTQITFGDNGSVFPTVNWNIDDVIINSQLDNYPIGPGYVKGYVPNADGTHTATGTNIVKGTIATPVGAAITGATTDANDWVDGVPLLGGAADNTRLINQQAVAAGEYVEVLIADTVERTPPRAVQIISADRQAATTAGSMEVRVVQLSSSPIGEATITYYSVSTGTITDKYTTLQLPQPPGGIGNWTIDLFNALRARFGYSGDATPDQYWRGIMVEAEYPEVARPVFQRPTRIIRKKVQGYASKV
jgi:hypothetical protein